MILLAAFMTVVVALDHERDYGGQFKQCVYAHQGETYTVTYPRYRDCPATREIYIFEEEE